MLSKTRIMVKFLIQRKQNTFHCYGIYTTHKNTIRPSKSTIASLVFFFLLFIFVQFLLTSEKKLVSVWIFRFSFAKWFFGSLVLWYVPIRSFKLLLIVNRESLNLNENECERLLLQKSIWRYSFVSESKHICEKHLFAATSKNSSLNWFI